MYVVVLFVLLFVDATHDYAILHIEPADVRLYSVFFHRLVSTLMFRVRSNLKTEWNQPHRCASVGRGGARFMPHTAPRGWKSPI